ncbi:hypothetical protein OHS33_10980 [Streptomyces sp. NBC_00536]|uniref:TRADD-N-associated membrane domain-containing protein n=1 Tax=Streptomyces sp. NBC_00536 TaxID=2975769 RepID=UPI002E807FEA|nr:hypothetical protein [Streptomyces sp. NBC_00536]WUC78816.1 hypothetical protein OHS33_10980 [Streptomyces sp. NBC_00536]
MVGSLEWVGGVGVGAVALAVGTVGAVLSWRDDARFERKRDEERERLLAQVGPGSDVPDGRPPGEVVGEGADPKYVDVGGSRPVPPVVARLGDRRDDFTPLLVEYYAYGLTQARSSFATSQRFAGFGATILLLGVGLAVWKAESTGDLYLGIVTSSVGVVVTLIGQLFHRRADLALRHMSEQTASLRDDRRAAETTQQAIGLLAQVTDPALKARLQAGLIMKLSGAELPPAEG